MDERPGPGLRRGPRPLLLHLTLAALRSAPSSSGSPHLSDDWMRWLGGTRGPGDESPVPELAGFDRALVDPALIAGIAAYRSHPYFRDIADPPSVWREGESVVLDHGGSGPVLLLVPSLINRSYVLDLSRERSMARYLASSGLRVLLLEWGWPSEADRLLDLDALITGRLARAIEAIGEKVILAGYCMGGLLTLAATVLNPTPIRGLALLATPWNFHATDPSRGAGSRLLLAALEPLLQATGTLPVDVLQLLFSSDNPQAVGNKYRSFATTDPASPRAIQFVALEDWLNDGMPLSAAVARTCLSELVHRQSARERNLARGRNPPSTQPS